MSEKKRIALLYIKLLQEAKLETIQNLFTKDAVVHSPVYGTMNAHQFYESLLQDTATSILELKGIFEEEETNRLSLYFSYTWTLVDDNTVTFDVVDIISFNNSHQITELHIIYDTVQSRVLVEALKSTKN